MAVDFNDPLQVRAFREKAVSAGKDPARIDKFIESKTGTRTVKAGETLSGISRETGTPVQQIAKESGIADPDVIQAGQKLKIQPAESIKPIKLEKQNRVLETKGDITQQFGNYNPDVEVMSGGINSGTDFGIKRGTRIAVPPGQWVVKEAFGKAPNTGFIGNRTNNGYGNSVLLQNRETGEQIRFSHLSPGVNARPGMMVKGGQVIARSGNSGNSTADHLDVEYFSPGGQLEDILKSRYRNFFR